MLKDAVGTLQKDNDLMRKYLARKMAGDGVIKRSDIVLNLFSFGNLYRSGEIFNDIIRNVGASTLPLGSHASD